VARDDVLAILGVENVVERRLAAGLFDTGGERTVPDLHLPRFLGGEREVLVTVLANRELFVTVHQVDLVLLGQRAGILDTGVTRADNHDGLVLELIRVGQRVEHARQALAGDAQLANIALQTDTQDHRATGQAATVLTADPELAGGLVALDGRDLLFVSDIDALRLERAIPLAEDALTLALGELHAAAQRQEARLGHHMLALLVLVDGVRSVVLGLEQHIAVAPLLSPRRRREACRPRPDDHDVVFGLYVLEHHAHIDSP